MYIAQTIWFPQVPYTFMEPEYINPAMDGPVHISVQASEQTFEVLIRFNAQCGTGIFPATINQDYQWMDGGSNEMSFTFLVPPGDARNITLPFTLLSDNATETNESVLITLSPSEISGSPKFFTFVSEACVLIVDNESKYSAFSINAWIEMVA